MKYYQGGFKVGKAVATGTRTNNPNSPQKRTDTIIEAQHGGEGADIAVLSEGACYFVSAVIIPMEREFPAHFGVEACDE